MRLDLTLAVAPIQQPGRAAPALFLALFLVFGSAAPASAGFRYVAPGQGMQQMAQPTANQNVPPPPVAMRGGSVQGFANQVPLPIALRQILPRGVAFSIADNIAPETKVNWQGGQSWQQTLEAMLAPAGLRAVYTSNKVLVTRDALAPAPLAPVVLTPPVDRITPLEIGSNTMPVQDAAPAMMEAAPLAPLTEAAPMQAAPVQAAPMRAAPEPIADAAPEPAPQMVTMQAAPLQLAAPPQPYIASSTGPAASLMPAGATIGAVQDAPPPVASATMAPLPEAQVQQQIASDPRPAPIGNLTAEVPGTENGVIPPMVMQSAQTSVAPGDVGDTAPAASLAAMDAQPGVAAAPWEAHSGQTLHETLADWAKRAGVELNWLSEYDYPIQASLTFSGSFEEAVRTLLGGFANAAPQPVGRLHRNEQLGQQALIIEMRGNAYDD